MEREKRREKRDEAWMRRDAIEFSRTKKWGTGAGLIGSVASNWRI